MFDLGQNTTEAVNRTQNSKEQNVAKNKNLFQMSPLSKDDLLESSTSREQDKYTSTDGGLESIMSNKLFKI